MARDNANPAATMATATTNLDQPVWIRVANAFSGMGIAAALVMDICASRSKRLDRR
jgi:hypothetical protein